MLTRMSTLVTALLLLALSATAPAAELPQDFQALYQLRVNSFAIGEAQVQLARQNDGRFLYSSHTYSTGLTRLFRGDQVRESSLFILHKNNLRPLEYRFDHTGSKKQRHAYLKFDWKQGEVANTVEGHTWEMDIPADALDKLVVQLAVMKDLTAGKQQLVYAIADGGKLKEYRFASVAKELITVPAGTYETIKLERLRKDNDRTTYLWCAPGLNYLPVKIKQIEHEDNVTYLSELKQTSIGGLPLNSGE